MRRADELRETLNRTDRKGYAAYKDLRGLYQFQNYVLSIDHVQADPFAPPSKVSVRVRGDAAGFPAELYDLRHKRVALQDHLTRLFYRQVEPFRGGGRGTGKSGVIAVSRCGQEILERSACQIDPRSGDIVLRLEIGFPARGRTIAAGELSTILFDSLPRCVGKALFYRALDREAVRRVAELAEDQQAVRDQLPELGLVAFVADGAVLPRASGVSRRPMDDAVKFKSPASMAVTLELPHRGRITGMGLRRGVNLIVGGGYHGKSTLLKALEAGVYNHIAGDGREFVITDRSAMKIRAEDGRSVKGVDISLFINGLPGGRDTHSFYTEDASGSTSQAAGTVEAMEAGTRLLLIDEDTSATNFMVRDALMQEVVHRESEPITPFIERVGEIYEQMGISSVIVVGSSGAYFHKADCVVQMDHYLPRDITEFAKTTAQKYPLGEDLAPSAPMPTPDRRPKPNRALGGRVKVRSSGRDTVSLDRENIDMRLVEQLVDPEQLTALGYLLLYAEKHLFDGERDLPAIVDRLMAVVERDGLAEICESGYLPSNLALPRREEIFCCLNRYRGLGL